MAKDSRPLLALYDMDNQDYGHHRILAVGYDPKALVLYVFPDTSSGEWDHDEGEPDMWSSQCGRYGIAPAYIVPSLEAPDA